MKCVLCGHNKAKVVETRTHPQWDFLMRRRYNCPVCNKRFFTLELSEGLLGSIKGFLVQHNRGVQHRVLLHQRNQKIVARMRAGEKYMAIAHEFGLSDSTLSYIARKYGVPSKRKKIDNGAKP